MIRHPEDPMTLWLGLFYVVVGIYLLLRHNAEAEAAIKWLEQASLRVMLGGTPRPVSPSQARSIKFLTLVAGVASLILGLASITVYALKK
jgi:uncharacterized membrane protein YfcA